MKVFISWSGETSHRVAKSLREWLPSVIQSVEPYVSSEDIDKGARWSTDIAGELQASSYGIICLTRDNIDAPWINFEAGALGKSVDKSRVSPFLFDLKRSEITGPILQFQSTVEEKTDVLKLLQSINQACEAEALDELRLAKTFEVWWPRLEADLEKLRADLPKPKDSKDKVKEGSTKSLADSVLEEILELSRNNHKLLRDPTAILPPSYLNDIINRRGDRREIALDISPSALADLEKLYHVALRALIDMRREYAEPNALLESALEAMEELSKPLKYILSRGDRVNEMRRRTGKIDLF